jgi:hypothetical protein
VRVRVRVRVRVSDLGLKDRGDPQQRLQRRGVRVEAGVSPHLVRVRVRVSEP